MMLILHDKESVFLKGTDTFMGGTSFKFLAPFWVGVFSKGKNLQILSFESRPLFSLGANFLLE